MKTLKYFVEAIIIYFLFLITKIIGIYLARRIISHLFLFFGFLFKSKKIVKKNIQYALGNIPEDQIKKIINFMWKNYGCTFVEYLYLKKYRYNKFSNPQIKITGLNILQDIVRSNKKAIFISGHFGNFELMAMELEKQNIKLGAIYRPLNNFFLNPFMVYLRKKYICAKQIKKGKYGAREVINLMQKNYSIALMVDQRLGESERYSFFKKPAHTTTLPAQLALKFKCNIIPIYLKRNDNDTFDMKVYEPLDIKKPDKIIKNKDEITNEINQFFEKLILNDPKQWIWTHNRWK